LRDTAAVNGYARRLAHFTHTLAALFAGLVGACSAELGGLGASGAVDPNAEAGVALDGGRDAGRDAAVVDAQASDGGGLRSCDGVASGTVQTQPGYAELLVRPPALCSAGVQTRRCTDGTWSEFAGQFPYTSCVVEGYASCGTIPHGTMQSRTLYAQGSAVSAAVCLQGEIRLERLCTDGSWSAWPSEPVGSVASCSVTLGGSCAVAGPLAAFACAAGSCDVSTDRCVQPDGGACAANLECAHTCIGGQCLPLQPPLGPCDDAEDCRGCTSGAQCLGNQCRCEDVSPCTVNEECVHTCLAGACGPIGTACDTNDSADCGPSIPCAASGSFWICVTDVGQPCNNDKQCKIACVSQQCSAPVPLGAPCESDLACATPNAKCSSNVCQVN